jgi:hypothetical protein
MGMMPARISALPLEVSIRTVYSTPDGRVVVVVGAKRILLVNAENPNAPFVAGQIPLTAYERTFALSPDGKTFLTALNARFRKDSDSVDCYDISDLSKPKLLWQRAYKAEEIAVAPDASAYAVMRKKDSPYWRWEIAVNWVGDEQSSVVLPIEYIYRGRLMLSGRGFFLAYGDDSELRMADLREARGKDGKKDIFYTCRTTGQPFLLMNNGDVLIEDHHVPRVRIYRNHQGISTIGKLDHGEHWSTMNGGIYRHFVTTVNQTVLVVDGMQKMHRIDISQPSNPRTVEALQLPSRTWSICVDGDQRLYVLRGTEDKKAELDIFDLAAPPKPVVNWRLLQEAHNKAQDLLRSAKLSKFDKRKWDAREIYESAFLLVHLASDPQGISKLEAANIFYSYALLGIGRKSSQALRRAIELDPKLKDAYLKLAETLYESLPGIFSEQKRRETRQDIIKNYLEYLDLGGESVQRFDNYMNEDFESDNKLSFCQAVAAYSNAGRLKEILYKGGAGDVPRKGRNYDISFEYNGTAHVPSITLIDADEGALAGDSIIDLSPFERLWGGDQLGLVALRGEIHILHYRDERHPVRSISFTGTGGCEFTSETEMVVGPAATELALCRDILAGKGPESIPFSTDEKPLQNEGKERYFQTEATGTAVLDLANDGHPITVTHLDMASGAGPGCDKDFFDLLDAEGVHFSDSPLRNQLLEMQGVGDGPFDRCGGTGRFFRYGGKLYLEFRPQSSISFDERQQYHEVKKIEGGKVQDVCDFRFKTHVRVTE